MTNLKSEYGLACPECGQSDRLRVVAEWFITLTPDGIEGSDDLDWTDHSYCECPVCEWSGDVHGASIDVPEAEGAA